MIMKLGLLGRADGDRTAASGWKRPGGSEVRSRRNGGFSLIELIIAVSILMVLSGLVFIGTGTFRRKETDKFANLLCNQIRLVQTTAMAKTGSWRLGLYEKDGSYFCVEERTSLAESSEEVIWETASEPVMLGYAGAVVYEGKSQEAGEPAESAEGSSAAEGMVPGRLIRAWRFDRDTGACIEGAGTLTLTGPGKTIKITVYRETGRCEAVPVSNGEGGQESS